jgi:hypothetical protein
MNNIKKMKNLKIIEDWEREYLKDFIYLHEQGQEWNEAIQRELNQKQPARIEVIDTDKILEKHNEPHANVLPF